ncbi:zinc ribbon domain-containing protein [Paenibacillus protaetiae]|uniref:Zinc ribbon domain-containing protein n=1 Tax=Paenibacillus protaetiae TaxID=2509456 RepID=A0A4V0YES5_9BACL|nr:zinc ribbon domain-containing protein [Paenibacillus protaetiae]QAY65231.1 zinc ribbon domain-containing protein [Paenibacillus protaetiae]
MSFMDKVKAGVAEAGSKAKTVVEINKLKMINISKQSSINQAYQEIGKRVFEFEEKGLGLPPQDMLEPYMNRVRLLKLEIEQNVQKMANLSVTKKCSKCGASVHIEERKCPKCEAAFEIIDVTDYETVGYESSMKSVAHAFGSGEEEPDGGEKR